MNTPAQPQAVYEFVTTKPDNVLEIETNADGEVHIRMARDNLSAQRKAFLVRELANEGFIPDHFLYLTDNELLGVKWSVSTDHVRPQPGISHLAANRHRIVVATCLVLWLALVIAFFTGAFGY